MDYDDPLICLNCGNHYVTDPHSDFCACCEYKNLEEYKDLHDEWCATMMDPPRDD